MIVDGYEVDEESRSADERGEQERGEQHLLDPNATSHASVQRSAKVAVDGRRRRKYEDRRGEQRASFRVQFSEYRENDDRERDGRQMESGADERRERGQVRHRPEHVAVDLFPAVLVAQVSLQIVQVLVFRVAGVVFAQRPHQNHRDESDEEDHHHEAVEYAEPVDAVLEEVGVQVLVESGIHTSRRIYIEKNQPKLISTRVGRQLITLSRLFDG